MAEAPSCVPVLPPSAATVGFGMPKGTVSTLEMELPTAPTVDVVLASARTVVMSPDEVGVQDIVYVVVSTVTTAASVQPTVVKLSAIGAATASENVAVKVMAVLESWTTGATVISTDGLKETARSVSTAPLLVGLAPVMLPSVVALSAANVAVQSSWSEAPPLVAAG